MERALRASGIWDEVPELTALPDDVEVGECLGRWLAGTL